MSSTFQVVEHVIPGQHIRGYPRSTNKRQEDVFRIAIKQYIPKDTAITDNAITVIAFHANGFPKEMYEPYLESVYLKLKAKAILIRAFWMADCFHQGASGVLNEDILGDTPDWFDTARDTLQMINHFRDEMPRPLVGISHSFTGAQLIHLCIMHPRLLSTVIICEPVLFSTPVSIPNPGVLPSTRRDYWNSRAEAEAKLSKPFATWDPRVLQLYFRYGLRSLPTPLYDPAKNPTLSKDAVTLTTSKHQESWTYTDLNFDARDEVMDRILRPDQNPQLELDNLAVAPQSLVAMQYLPNLRPSCLWVFGNKSYLSPKEEQDRKLSQTGTGTGGSGGVKVGKVKKVSMEKAGHLIPFEKDSLEDYATVSADWIAEWFPSWLEDEKIIREHHNLKSSDGMRRMTKHWIAGMKLKTGSPRPFLPRDEKL